MPDSRDNRNPDTSSGQLPFLSSCDFCELGTQRSLQIAGQLNSCLMAWFFGGAPR
jgi:hypothetical protein